MSEEKKPVHTSVLLPPEDRRAVEIIADKEDRSVSYVAARLIREALNARRNAAHI